MKKNLLIVLFTGFSLIGSGQIYQVLGVFSPSYEMVNYRGQESILNPKFSMNGGFEINYFTSPTGSIRFGLMVQNKGASTQPVYQNSAENNGNLLIAYKYLMVPINFNKYKDLGEDTKLVYTAGFSNGITFEQSIRGKRINASQTLNDPLLPDPNNPEKQRIEYFKSYYLGINVGVGVVQYIKSKLTLAMVPMYQRSIIDLVNPKDGIVGVGKVGFDSFAIDLKIGYLFNTNIDQRKKTF